MLRPSVLLLLSAGLVVPDAGRCQPPPAGFPDLRTAEREVREGRAELEELLGPKLLRAEAPPLPEVSDDALSPVDRELLERTGKLLPEDWAAEDRARVEELLPVDLRLRSALAARGRVRREVLEASESFSWALHLLTASRVLTLGDRLAFLEGEEAAFVDGLELRANLAERLSLQPGLLGPLVGSAIFRSVLLDLRRAVVRADASRAGLERLETLLFRWLHSVPGPAAMVAREGLLILEQAEASRGEPAHGDPAADLFLAHVARDYAELARRCRDQGCRKAVQTLRELRDGGDDVYRVVADMLLPNIWSAVEKLDATSELAEVAAAAVALRLEALESGAYPANLESLPTAIAAGSRASPALSLEHLPAGGARLRYSAEDLFSAMPEERREELRPLLVWELPPLKARPEASSAPLAPRPPGW